MKRLLFALLVLGPLVVFATAQPSGAAAEIDRYLSKRVEMGSFSGAVLVVRDGRVVIRKGYGYADVDKRIPYTPETRQPVASISKMFTSMAVLLLRDRGKLRLDDSICKYIDECPNTWRPVTIQHLMRHTSGVPDYEAVLELGSDKYLAFMTEPDSSGRIVTNARKLPLDFPPGQKFSYSNTGYILLALVVKKAADEPYETFVRDNILRPARMSGAGYVVANHVPAGLAVGYTSETLPWDKVLAGVSLTDGHLKRVPVIPTSPSHGDAALYMTVDDLYRWSDVMDGNGVIPEMDVREALTPGAGNYGYGWFVGLGFDRRRARHNGGLPGYISNIDKYLDDHLTLILFCNQDHARLSNIARDIAAIVLGKPWDMPVQGTVLKLSAEQLGRLEGQYKMSDGGTLTIKNEEYLTASLPGRFVAGLIPLSPTDFYFPLADGRATFVLGPDSKAAKVTLRYSGEDHPGDRTY